MSDLIRKNEVTIYSAKYNIHGLIKDYGFVIMLFFSYNNEELIISIYRNSFKDEELEEIGINTIESFIENHVITNKIKTPALHHWYICRKEKAGQAFNIAVGIIIGHRGLPDNCRVRTSPIKALWVEEEIGELLLKTENSVYHCPLEHCSFDKQDSYSEVISEYNRLKKKYNKG